jgi:hypothetical protein
MSDLFMSYAREDRECAQRLAEALSRRGWTVWWDRQIQVGQSFSEVIERELEQARCVIVLWSQHSLESEWVQNEAAEAARKKMLVPVRIEDVRPPLEFRRLQAADLFGWRSGFDTPEFDACLSSIEMLVGGTASRPLPSRQPAVPPPSRATAPSPPPPPPPSSGAQGTIPNYLVPSILVTLFCCIPFGIAAIVYAGQVNTKLAAGDIDGARKSSDLAKRWCLIAVAGGILTAIVWLIAFIASQSGQATF